MELIKDVSEFAPWPEVLKRQRTPRMSLFLSFAGLRCLTPSIALVDLNLEKFQRETSHASGDISLRLTEGRKEKRFFFRSSHSRHKERKGVYREKEDATKLRDNQIHEREREAERATVTATTATASSQRCSASSSTPRHSPLMSHVFKRKKRKRANALPRSPPFFFSFTCYLYRKKRLKRKKAVKKPTAVVTATMPSTCCTPNTTTSSEGRAT